MRDIALQPGPNNKRARRFIESPDRHQGTAHVRMDDDRIGRLVGILRAGQRAALQTLFGVDDGVLIGDLGLGETLNADAQASLVHHYEHGIQAAVFLANQPAGGAVVIHHAGRVAVNAHLFFERATGHAVALAKRTVILDHDLGHDEQRDALGTGRRAFDARQDKMDDVLRHVVFAGGDEYFGAGDFIAAVRLLDRLGAQQPQVGAAMRLGQIHGAGPGAGHHLRQVLFFQLLRGVYQHRGDRALGQAGIHGEGHIAGTEEFVDHFGNCHRQALPAEFFRHRNADPAAVDHLLEGFLETFGRRDRTVGVAGAALHVADAIERGQDVLAELGRLAQHRLDHVR
jgi:hypothetical protein